jgi:hypothetical protein
LLLYCCYCISITVGPSMPPLQQKKMWKSCCSLKTERERERAMKLHLNLLNVFVFNFTIQNISHKPSIFLIHGDFTAKYTWLKEQVYNNLIHTQLFHVYLAPGLLWDLKRITALKILYSSALNFTNGLADYSYFLLGFMLH